MVCGTLCILAPLGAIAYLYPLHAIQPGIHHNGPEFSNDLRLGVFVGILSLLAFAAGVALVTIGVRIESKA